MDGDGVMDRDTHMDRQWVCGVYSQLEWFSNAQNALSLRWLVSQAVHRAYMSLPRFPLSDASHCLCIAIHVYHASHCLCIAICVPHASHCLCIALCVPHASHFGAIARAFPRTGAFAYACWELRQSVGRVPRVGRVTVHTRYFFFLMKSRVRSFGARY
jgi:hypothetical protein